jgi:septum formation protein
MKQEVKFILASGSPRRGDLLDQMGLQYQVITADIDENVHVGEAAADYVNRIAARKAHSVATSASSDLPVLAADTAVVLDGRILGKPLSVARAKEMLRSLSARTHEVFSAVALVVPGEVERRRLNVSRVTFAALDGAYAIQGFAAQHITRLEGSYTGVMGLPLFETMGLLQEAGIRALPGVNVK